MNGASITNEKKKKTPTEFKTKTQIPFKQYFT